MPGQVRILHHATHIEVFDDDDAVVLGVVGTYLVQDGFALTPHLAVQPHDAELGFLSISTSFLSARDCALGASEALERPLEMFGVEGDLAVGVGDQVGDAAVERDDRSSR